MTEKIELTYTSEEGRIGFQVDDVYYEYQLDTSYFPAVLKMNQSQPSEALNFVRKISPGMTKFRVNKLKIAIKALKEIRDTQGKVCQEFEICDCVGCKSSYASWAIADKALQCLASTAQDEGGNTMREKEAKKWYEIREGILKRWDIWRRYIASGGKSSWPRDEFESLLDYLFKQ